MCLTRKCHCDNRDSRACDLERTTESFQCAAVQKYQMYQGTGGKEEAATGRAILFKLSLNTCEIQRVQSNQTTFYIPHSPIHFTFSSVSSSKMQGLRNYLSKSSRKQEQKSTKLHLQSYAFCEA